jgi:hypothetical protein
MDTGYLEVYIWVTTLLHAITVIRTELLFTRDKSTNLNDFADFSTSSFQIVVQLPHGNSGEVCRM